MLTAVSLAEPILQSLIGGATTEDEALQIQLESNPDLLITSEDLERGYGIRLVEKQNNNPQASKLSFSCHAKHLRWFKKRWRLGQTE